ncbi:acyl-CoA synthetase (NDP forming) [Rhodoligotrophos appendicifer]|uniref:acetate--CoA ligase family protein n=1 Tax=Rhodoligotrophos appendicifer TaxID=987056 RepID=UPI001185D2A6|nr:acetate--CoA ligase family protein [Rhodoligotrophos appendicifer]
MTLNSHTTAIPDRLHRLLNPRSIAFIGGSEAETALKRTLELGFPGQVYAVNPKREMLAGIACVRTVDHLPQDVDAAFVGVPRGPTIEIVTALRSKGCGGAVVYASGFTETGSEGEGLQAELLSAAAGMPLMGPNCYGFINVPGRCALWPDIHALSPCTKGVAIVTQSGNLACNLTFLQRGLAVAGIFTLGNQADINIGTMVDALVADDRVTAIGLHIEGLSDVPGFAAAARRALAARKPIVALKTGRSEAGARVAKSHTGSLAGADSLYSALFKRYGIARATSLTTFVETLKFLCIVGPLPGNRLVSMSCSGGEAALVADMAEGLAIEFPAFGETAPAVRETLNAYVAIENPLDYHTFIWGRREQLEATFSAVLSGPFDLGFLILDTPTAGLPSADWYTAADALALAADRNGVKGAIVANLQECLPEPMRERMSARGIAPMAGLEEALVAFEAAAFIGCAWARPLPPLLPAAPTVSLRPVVNFTEREAKDLLSQYGIPVPRGEICSPDEAGAAADRIGYPVVLKASGAELLHKSDMGGVILDLRDRPSVEAAAVRLSTLSNEILVEEMVRRGVAEIIVGATSDPQFGQILVIGAGGVLTELLRDTATLLLPTTREEVEEALSTLRVAKLIDGFRGTSGDRGRLVDAIIQIAAFSTAHAATLIELDVNPLIIRASSEGVIAVDALLQMHESN